MKVKSKIICSLMFVCLMATAGIGHAQTNETLSPLSLTPSDLKTLPSLTDAQAAALVSALDATPTISTEGQPRSGTFWSLANPSWPPSPGNFNGFPVWLMDSGNAFLLDDLDFDYAAQATVQRGRQMMSLSEVPGFDDLDTNGVGTNTYFYSSYTIIDYGTNLWIAQVQATNNFLAGIGTNTEADIQYEIQSRTNLLQSDWQSEGFIYGDETTNWTPLSVAQNGRTNLFLRLRSWADDGTGLPIWWQEQYGVSDPYGDPDGDGWNNLQEFQNETDPNTFNTPAAPQLSVFYDDFNGLANVSWIPSLTPATNYTVERVDYFVGLNNTTNFYPSGGTENWQDRVPIRYANQWDDEWSARNVYSYYRIQAHYAVGDSAWSPPAYVRPKSYASVTLVPGPQGSAYLAVASLPVGTTALRIIRVDFYAQEYEDDFSFNITNDIPVSDFTNGLYLLPSSIAASPTDAYGHSIYNWWVEPINEAGNGIGESKLVSSGISTGVWENWIVTPYFDGRMQLKQNLTFLLRAATIDEPLHWKKTGTPFFPDLLFTNPPTYEYAGFFPAGDANGLYTDQSFDYLSPFQDNYNYRNFVYNFNDLDENGRLATGLDADYAGEYYSGLILPNSPLYQTTLLGTNTQWLATYAFDSSADYLGEIGVTPPTDTDPNFYMAGNARNFYGLPFVSAKIAYGTGSGAAEITLPAGSSTTQGGYFYPEVAQPQFQTVEYDFWSAPELVPRYANTLLPGASGFSTSSHSDLLIAAVGDDSFAVAGYAKLAVMNGYSDVYGYLGQYFDQAYAMTNDIVTTNETGVLSPYGIFFATEPGPAALMTMPDLDTGERGTCVVNAISLNGDKNADGVLDLSFNGADATSQASPMKFWVNNRYYGVDGDLMAGNGIPPNYSLGNMTGLRDLENFARLWVCGMPVLTNGYQVTLSWASVSSGNPGINLYNAVETNGGTGYLTDTNIAFQQSVYTNVAGYGYGYSKVGPGVPIAQIPNGTAFTFPASYFTNSGNKYFLFEGAGIGTGELMLTITDNNSNIIAQTGLWLDLHEVRDFYEQAHTANIDTAPPSTKTSVLVKDKMLPANSAEDQQVIVFVHGLNTSQSEYYATSDTMFKRLYWQGYHGRFAAFRWPSPLFALIPTGTNEISYLGFNTGEYISWHSGAALKAYIDDLRSRLPGYTVNLAAHSLGNVAANEAIREGAQVDNYALMQAAISAGAFDGGNSALTYDYLASTANGSPNANALGGYNNCATNATRRVNFYNDDDFALFKGVVGGVTTHTWEGNQLDYKPDHYTYFGGRNYSYSFDGTNCFYNEYTSIGGLLANRTVTEDFEKKAFIARSRTKAVGAAGLKYEPYTLSGGVISTNISLQNASLGFVGGAQFGATRSDHSGEFTKPIQNTIPFYFQLLKIGFQLQPKITP